MMKLRKLSAYLGLTALMASTAYSADYDSLPPPGSGDAAQSCQVLEANDPEALVRTWTTCSTAENDEYRLTGKSDAGEIHAEIIYTVGSGKANFSVRYEAEYGEIISEYIAGTVTLDAHFSNLNHEQDYSAGAQLELSAEVCHQSTLPISTDSSFASTTAASTSGSLEDDIALFFEDPAVKSIGGIVQRIYEELSREKLFGNAALPLASEAFQKFGVVDSSLLSFEILQDSLKENNDYGTQGMGSCILAALGATGAIIGAIQSNPNLSTTCIASCGMALGCLGTLVSGGATGPACVGGTSVCLYCVGLGYQSNVTNCFRHFVSVY